MSTHGKNCPIGLSWASTPNVDRRSNGFNRYFAVEPISPLLFATGVVCNTAQIMRHPLLIPDLRELIADRDEVALGEFFSAHHPAEAAELIDDLEPQEALFVIGLLTRPRKGGCLLVPRT